MHAGRNADAIIAAMKGFDLAVVKGRDKGQARAGADTHPDLSFTTSSDGFCHGSGCSNPILPIDNGWRRTVKLFCSDKCKLDAWAIRRVRKLIEGMSDREALKILRGAK